MTLINKTKFLNNNDFLVRMLYIQIFVLILSITCSIQQTGLNWCV